MGEYIMRTISLLSLLFLFVLVFGACDTNEPGTHGRFVLTLSDAPGNYDEVNIQVTSVDVHSVNDGWVTLNSEDRSFDLLVLTNGAIAVLADATLDAGRYTEIRLMIGDGSNVVVEGTPYNLNIPSGLQTGLKLVQTFEIETDFTYQLHLDFDAHRSVQKLGVADVYTLQPAYRIQAVATSGAIAGTAEPAEARAVVKLMNNTEVVTTTYADLNTGEFKLIHVPEGIYNLLIEALEGEYEPAEVNNVQVTIGNTTDVGTISLD
jgi:hypothetical protein